MVIAVDEVTTSRDGLPRPRTPIDASARPRRLRVFFGAAPSAIIAATTTLALATFAFETAQSWAAENDQRQGMRWAFPFAVSIAVLALGATAYLCYWLARSATRGPETDSYRQYVDGVLAYGDQLRREKRDPALMRLRHGSSLTLHVLGFHAERVLLGTWALESAQFLDDRLSIMEVLMDDLGWGNYLLGKPDTALTNIRRAIEYGERVVVKPDGRRTATLLAKAYRHLGVIETTQGGHLHEAGFARSRALLTGLGAETSPEVAIDLAHVDHAEALAIVSMLRLNQSGSLRRGDSDGEATLRGALALARRARDQFKASGDQGRFAKSLVLEVRILEALHEQAEAVQLALLRDRAVAASVWARPSGATFITGR